MYILNDLWHGNITPCERYIRSGSEYQQVSQQFCDAIEMLREDLSPEKLKQWDVVENLQLQLIDMSEEDTFIVGFRLGARMILDIIGEYKGQFKTPAEI